MYTEDQKLFTIISHALKQWNDKETTEYINNSTYLLT